MASKEQLFQKQNNVSKILAQIREKGAVSRMELCDGLSLSWACVSDLVSEMITLGLVEEGRTVACGKGRVPTILQLNESKLFVGIDAHDTGMSASICDLYGNKKCNVQISENLNGLSLLDKVKTVLSTVFSQNSMWTPTNITACIRTCRKFRCSLLLSYHRFFSHYSASIFFTLFLTKLLFFKWHTVQAQ